LVKFKAAFHQDNLLSTNPGDVVGLSIDDEVLPAVDQATEELVEKTASVDKRREDALDALARSDEQLQELSAQRRIVEEKVKKCEETLQKEQKAHAAKMDVHIREVEVMEDKVASMRDPVALEEQKLAYERQLAELELMQVQHREEIQSKKHALKQEIEVGCQLMMEHERHYQNKMKELEQYWDEAEKVLLSENIEVPENLGLFQD